MQVGSSVASLALLVGLLCILILGAAGTAGSAPSELRTDGTLATITGRSIYGDQLRIMLDEFIPTGNVHSTLMILTQSYGGEMMSTLAGRPNTSILSATSPGGERVTYGGYDVHAAAALRPEVGWTSEDVHDAGLAGKADGETPDDVGPPLPLDPVGGVIQGRQILVYAGRPISGPERDTDQRDTIIQNFAGEANTTVTTVGGDGSGQWNYPATHRGLQEALQVIGAQLSPNQQFILFVTDHGDMDRVDETPNCNANVCVSSAPLALGENVYEDMLDDPANQPGVSLFFFDPITPTGKINVTIGSTTVETVFDISIDLNGDGDLEDLDEGWQARADFDESAIDPLGVTVSTNYDAGSLVIDRISLESGEIKKHGSLFYVHLPLILR